MQTGRQTLGQIEDAAAKLREEESRIDGALRSALSQQEHLQSQRMDALRELARVKLGEMAAGRLVANLDAAEQRAAQIIADRKHRLETTAGRQQAALAEASAAETERQAAGAAVEQTLAAVEAIRTEAEGRVRGQADWQAAKTALDAAAAVASEAGKKATSSETELGAKKRPYDDDPLFLYLWNRNFGTRTYAAGNIVRMMDRTVAEFIGFSGARANYAMLIEITARLREHANAQARIADEARAGLATIERTAMVAAGIDDKERVLAAARHKLAAAEATLAAKRGQLAALDKETESLVAAGGEAAYKEAIETIAAGDAQDDIATLYREARRTKTLDDETLVRRIEQIDADRAKADTEAAELRKTAQDLARRRLEVESVRDNFRSAGYDHPHVTFGNEMDIGRVIGSILEGAVRSGVLWDVVRGGFGTRPPSGRPGFGAPSFPFPFPIPGGGDRGPSGGGWREPSSQGGWFPPANSAGDSSSGGSGSGSGGGGSSRDDNDDFTTGGRF